MEEKEVNYSLFTAHELLNKRIDQNAELIMKLEALTKEIGLVKPLAASPELKKCSEVSGDTLLSRYYDLVSKMDEINCRFESIFIQLHGFVS